MNIECVLQSNLHLPGTFPTPYHNIHLLAMTSSSKAYTVYVEGPYSSSKLFLIFLGMCWLLLLFNIAYVDSRCICLTHVNSYMKWMVLSINWYMVVSVSILCWIGNVRGYIPLYNLDFRAYKQLLIKHIPLWWIWLSDYPWSLQILL